MSSEILEYRGYKILSLKRDKEDHYRFTFGFNKAKLILDNFQAIKDFVKSEIDPLPD